MLTAIGSGLAGALTLTAVHETARHHLDDAPRMDVLGMRAIAKSMRAMGTEPPSRDRLHDLALMGDVASNSIYYSMVGLAGAKNALLCGALLGLAAGIGALTLPGPMGLGKAPSNRTTATQFMTVGWYLLGGLAAGAAYSLLGPREDD